MATIKDVAALAGVSTATVSRLINQNGYVSKHSEERILQAMEQLNYEPLVLRKMTALNMPTIGLVLPDIANPFFSELARAIEDFAQPKGYAVFFCNSDHQDFKEKNYMEFLRKRNIDGIIYASSYLTQEELQKLRKEKIPFVLIDRAFGMEKSTVIRCNNFQGAQIAVQHLLESGCSKIAHVYGPWEAATAKERTDGYESVVRSYAWYTPSLMAPGFFQIEGGMSAVHTLLRRHPDIDGIFAGNDLMAIGVLKALHRMGVRIPDDIAICGFDGIKLTEIVEPELTTVTQPIYEMGMKAAQLLIQQIEVREAHLEVVELDVSLTVRDSTRRRSEQQ
ncbi:LacI family transcriptional regulator [Paenibacillus sp. J2TS4]|nr:LacI family transcriptional regulator [Paenibacillus sp. J2TS4]